MQSKQFTKLWRASMWIAGWNSNKRQSNSFWHLKLVNSCQIHRTLSTYFYGISSRSETLNSVSLVQDQINFSLKRKLVSYTGNWLRCCKCHKDIFAFLRAVAREYKEMCQNNCTTSCYFHYKYSEYFLALLSLCRIVPNLEKEWVLYLHRRRRDL